MFRCASCGAFNRVPDRHAGVPTCGRCKKDLDVSGAPQDVDAAQFERVVSGSPVPVLVDFWAPWCPPCRMAAPILDGVGRELAGKALVVKVNSDQHPEPSARLGIRGIPTFIVFRDGAEKARQAGLASAEQLRSWAVNAVS
jgi:thioredoxin 2